MIMIDGWLKSALYPTIKTSTLLFLQKKTGAFIRFTKKALLGAVLLTIAPMATLFRGCTCPCTNARIHRFKLVGELT